MNKQHEDFNVISSVGELYMKLIEGMDFTCLK